MSDESPDVVVVGAGLAGLTAARRLARQGRDVVVLDKGRGPGGRMATRRLDDAGGAVADHGAQFFTVRSEVFAAVVDGWPVRVWHHGPVTARSITDGPDAARPAGDGHPRFVGDDGMNAIAAHLATGLDVRVGVRVTRVAPEGDRWRVDGAAGSWSAARVLVTAPVPQAVELCAVPLPADVTALTYEPCLALLATLDGPSGLPGPGAVQFDEGPVRFMADNQSKGVSARPTVTLHASGSWSTARYGASDEDVADALRGLVAPWLAAAVEQSQVKRWRYATPRNPHPDRAVEPVPGLVVAGDAFGGPKVEGAVLSGLAAAALLAR